MSDTCRYPGMRGEIRNGRYHEHHTKDGDTWKIRHFVNTYVGS